MEEAHAPVTVLASLREYGLRLMLDDFGTGYSSLSYLKRFPLDVLKIDRSFIAGLGRDEEDSAIVAAIVQMAQTLGLTVIAEGVERPEQLDRLRELDCDRAQGRLIAEPMPAERGRAADGARDRRLTRCASSTGTTTRSRASRGRTDARRVPRRRRRRAPRPAAGRGRRPGRRLLRRLHVRPPDEARTSRAPTSRRSTSAARCAEALAQVALLLRLERESGGRLRVVRSAGRPRRPTALAAVLHLEGAEPIGPGSTSSRCCTPPGCARSGWSGAGRTRSPPGVPFGFPGSPDQGPGLTDAGRALVRACDELGILVDVSHLNARGFWDVAELSDRAARRLALRRARPVRVAAQPHRRRSCGRSASATGWSGSTSTSRFLRADGADDAATPLALIAEHAAHVAEVAGVDVRRARLRLRRRDDAGASSAT